MEEMSTLFCPYCKSKQVFVATSRPPKRRRQCSECGFRWSTYEVSEDHFKLLKSLLAVMDFSPHVKATRS